MRSVSDTHRASSARLPARLGRRPAFRTRALNSSPNVWTGSSIRFGPRLPPGAVELLSMYTENLAEVVGPAENGAEHVVEFVDWQVSETEIRRITIELT
jgi:hypothetical protein